MTASGKTSLKNDLTVSGILSNGSLNISGDTIGYYSGESYLKFNSSTTTLHSYTTNITSSFLTAGPTSDGTSAGYLKLLFSDGTFGGNIKITPTGVTGIHLKPGSSGGIYFDGGSTSGANSPSTDPFFSSSKSYKMTSGGMYTYSSSIQQSLKSLSLKASDNSGTAVIALTGGSSGQISLTSLNNIVTIAPTQISISDGLLSDLGGHGINFINPNSDVTNFIPFSGTEACIVPGSKKYWTSRSSAAYSKYGTSYGSGSSSYEQIAFMVTSTTTAGATVGIKAYQSSTATSVEGTIANNDNILFGFISINNNSSSYAVVNFVGINNSGSIVLKNSATLRAVYYFDINITNGYLTRIK